ncbi:hypothetical protein LMH87_010250 [Akanthomyces muscarius]|uniref:Major facilitator superfamily (MFS) profile domain-containing protein n=1 Tax=Akanthomyces muscarius TaxID=2231603 RepID=A0A9W8UN11_AKAMU|nr:hypothetical protein LMH87_010250 [Akanthomyces muscarius]KAJ4153777.1 hypothetical protein LMH87_010250 [Akanthomyces muscarius]
MINGAEVGREAFLLGATTAIGGLLFGYDTGQISGLLLFEEFEQRFATTEPDGSYNWRPLLKSLLVSLMSIGCLIGALSGAYTADWWGRRRSLSFGVAVFIAGDVIQITAVSSWIHMMMGRFVAGLGIGSLSVGVPMFQSESSPREIRGAVVASYQLMITIGILSANILNYSVRAFEQRDWAWRIVIGVAILLSLPLGIGVMCVPESPRWLASRGDWEAGNGSWLECFCVSTSTPKVLYRTLLGIGIHFLQQWSGINFFFYYGATVFQSTGVEDPILTQLILGSVNVAMTFFGLYVVERFGRRWPLFLGGLWQAGWLLVFATVGTMNAPETHPQTGIIMIVCACMFIASFAATWGPMAWVVIGETFPLRTRAKQAALATAGNWLGNFMIGFLTPIATSGIGYAFGFVFVGTNLVAALLVYFFLYESRMLSLEHVDLMYGEKLNAWNSSKWVPPGYITREQRAVEK